jgi:hypothetical protein
MTRNKKVLAAAAAFAALAVSAGGSAFTASNTVPAHVLGAGTATVSGAVVVSTNYDLDSTNQSTVQAVHFVVAALPTSTVAQVKITGANGLDTGWLSCTTTNATHIDCDTSADDPVVADINSVQLLVH